MVVWYEQPKQKITIAGVEITGDCVETEITRRENAIDDCLIIANDDVGKTFIAQADIADEVKIYYKYEDGDNTWVQVFGGYIVELNPQLDNGKEICGIRAYGYGIALKKMVCAQEYGFESRNPSYFKLNQILATEDAKGILHGWTNNILGNLSLPSGHSIDKDWIYNPTFPIFDYLQFPYVPITSCLKDLCNIFSAGQFLLGLAGIHWIVDVNKRLFVAPVGDHNQTVVGGNIETEWATHALNGNIIRVTKDMLLRRFTKSEFNANYIVYSAGFQRPANGDKWTKGNSLNWASSHQNLYLTDAYDSNNDIDYLNARLAALVTANFSYPISPLALGIDFTKIGTRKTNPTIDFYIYIDGGILNGTGQITLKLGTGLIGDLDYFYYTRIDAEIGEKGKFYHISLPVGPYLNREKTDIQWCSNGDADWKQIDYIMFEFSCDGNTDAIMRVARLKFNGILIRGAYDPDHITTNKCKMMLIKDTISKDDTLVAEDDSGTIGLLALAELLKAIKTPLTGQIVIPLSPTIMAGQIIRIKASRAVAGAQIDGFMRILEVRHNFSVQAVTTTLTLSDDLSNSYPMLPSDAINAILKATDPTKFQDRIRGSLIGSDIDILQTILAKDYDTSDW